MISRDKQSSGEATMAAEEKRLQESEARTAHWKRWGPYLSERAWGTVREDYSPHGTAWDYLSHEQARSKAYRWGEDGIAGISDRHQKICFAVAMWNGRDPILKERLFGLTGGEGNHGEDVKELYYYLDSTPTHSYMKMLYKYPQQEYPYAWLVAENKRRTRNDPEFELIDTGLFDNDKYFDVFTEYAKSAPGEIYIRITIHNRGDEDASLNVLPTIWFRNTWDWGYDDYIPHLAQDSPGVMDVYHKDLGQYWLKAEGKPQFLFCDNETNAKRLYGVDDGK